MPIAVKDVFPHAIGDDRRASGLDRLSQKPIIQVLTLESCVGAAQSRPLAIFIGVNPANRPGIGRISLKSATWPPFRVANPHLGPVSEISSHADRKMPLKAPHTSSSLKVYKGAPPGMCTTLKDQVNEDLLAFIQS